MPELPEAETIARGLAAQITNCTILTVHLHRTDIIRIGADEIIDALRGRTVHAVSRRGKRVVIEFHPHGTLIVALGMTGRLTTVASDTPLAVHTHLQLLLGDGTREVRFRDPRRFGGIWFYDQPPESEIWKPLQLGLEPTSISLPQFRALLQRHRQIKALLMDQHVLAGLGNIYCDESLHRAGIHPLTRSDQIDAQRIKKLHRAMRSILAAAIKAGGSTIDDYRNANGDEGFFQIRHRVYGREGQPCHTCRTKILRIQAAGRSTHFCPICQIFRSRPEKSGPKRRRRG